MSGASPDQKPEPANETVSEPGALSADEQAQFDAMRDGGGDPGGGGGGGAPAGDAGGGGAAPAGDKPVDGAAGAQPAAKPGEGGETDEDADDEEADPAAAVGADGKAPAAGDKPPPRRVSYGKFQRMEQKARKLEVDLGTERAERAKLSENTARLDERIKLINEALSPSQAKEAQAAGADDPEPDPEADIFAYVRWQRRELGRMGEQISGQANAKQAETNDAGLANYYTEDAKVFAAKEPNFIPAYGHLMASRMAELAQYFYGIDIHAEGADLSPEQVQRIKATVVSEEKQLVAMAVQARQSDPNAPGPAQRMFALARARGYRPGAPAAAAAAAPAANGGAAPNALTGGAPAAAAAAAAAAAGKPKPAGGGVTEEIARIKQGQEAGRSLSSGGAQPQSPLTIERLVNMPDHEFGALLDSMSPAEQAHMLAGGE